MSTTHSPAQQSFTPPPPISSPPVRLARKRRRPALSCVACRRRKVRCDREEPCGPCRRMGHPAACVYVAHHNGPPATTQNSDQGTPAWPSSNFYDPVRHPSTPHGSSGNLRISPSAAGADCVVDRLQQRVLELQEALERTQNLLSDKSRSSDPSDLPLRQTVHDLAQRLTDIEHRTVAKPERQHNHNDAPDLCIPPFKPWIRSTLSATRFRGPTHYIHCLDQSNDVFGKTLRGRDSNLDALKNPVTPAARGATRNEPEAARTIERLRNIRKLRKTLKERLRPTSVKSLQEAAEPLLSKSLVWDFIKAYIHTLEPLFRVLHVPTFWRECEQYIPDFSKAPACFLVATLLISAIGSIFVAEPREYCPQIPQWIYAAQTWLTGPQERLLSSEYAVQCWCLLILARQATSTGTKEQTYILAGAMQQSAFAANLHRDPTTMPEMSLKQAEVRRRLWQTVKELSLLASNDANLPPLLAGHEWDCKPPSNYDDQDLSDQLTSTQPTQVSSDSAITDSSIQALLHASFTIRLEVARFAHDACHNLSYEKALQLTEALRAGARHVDTFFDPLHRAGRNYQPNWSEPSELHHALISAVVWQSILFIHQPFIAAAKRDLRFYFSRQIGTEASMALLSHRLDLHTGSRCQMSQFSRLALSGRGVFRSTLGLSAMIILAQEVIAQLEPASATFHTASTYQAQGSQMSFPPASEVARASCEPLIARLEHICHQSRHLIAQGVPSCKRYAFLITVLARIHSLYRGERKSGKVQSALAQCLVDCESMLTEQASRESAGSMINGVEPVGRARNLGDLPNLTAKSGPAAENANTSASDSMIGDEDLDFNPSWLLPGWEC